MLVQRLGKTIDRYSGETIDLTVVLNDCVVAARANGWSIENISAAPKLDLLAFIRPREIEPQPSPRVYISAGIHGDEPAGPLAVRTLLQENTWPNHCALWLCPCLNPSGFARNLRENARGTDLNRQSLHPQAEEIVAHIDWLKRQPNFDLCLCLHEDWESHGFYIYELNPDNRPSLAEAITSRVSAVFPIDPSELIEGRPAQNGIIRPVPDPITPLLWPEAFYLLKHQTRLSYTGAC